MNKIKIYISTFLILIIVFFSCSRDELQNQNLKLKVSNFSKSGEIHNAFLTNVKSNFHGIENIDTKEIDEVITEIYDFNNDFVQTLDLTKSKKENLSYYINKHKKFVNNRMLMKKYFGSVLKPINKNNDENLIDQLLFLKQSDAISDKTFYFLDQLILDVKSNYNNTLTINQLKFNLENLIEEYNNYGYDINSEEGKMIGNVLAISIASLEWWENNLDALGSNKVAHVVATDIAGAIGGAIIGAIASYSASGEVSGTAIGVGAVAGALVASTGMYAEIGRIFASWFS